MKEDGPDLVSIWAPKHLLELVLTVPASTVRPDKFRSVAPPETGSKEQQVKCALRKVLKVLSVPESSDLSAR